MGELVFSSKRIFLYNIKKINCYFNEQADRKIQEKIVKKTWKK